MHLIAFASTKGGVGKTTLTAAMAVAAARKGHKVAIYDFDPIHGLARWFDRRRLCRKSDRLMLIEPASRLDDVIIGSETKKH